MRPAPPLALRCAASRAWRLACVAVGAASGAALAIWLAGHLGWVFATAAAALASAAAAGAGLGLAVAGSGLPALIAWDGRSWRVDGVPGELQVMLDFGRFLLLMRHRPAAAPRRRRWLAVSFPGGAPDGADDLRALRTALYSSAPEDTPDGPHVRAPDRNSD